MKTFTWYKFRYATQKRARHNTMQIHKASANRQKELYIDQCFRSLLDLLHESSLIKEKLILSSPWSLILLTSMPMKTIRVYHRHKKQYHFGFPRRRLYALTADSAIFSTYQTGYGT